MNVIVAKNANVRVKKVRKLIDSAGDRLVAASFIKRSDGSKRNMVFRRHVSKPQYAPIPGSNGRKHKKVNKGHGLLTVFDTNVLRYNNKGRLCGRGDYKSIPLDGIYRLKVGGVIYKIVS